MDTVQRSNERGRQLVIAITIAIAALSGCGYALAGRGSFLPSHIKAINIPQVENKTSVSRIELAITEKIRSEFIGRGKYQTPPDASAADAVLQGEIVAITSQVAGTTAQQLASRYLVTVVLKVTLTDVRTREVLWSNDPLTIRDEYDLVGGIDGATFVDQQRGMVERIATDVARAVVTAIAEAF